MSSWRTVSSLSLAIAVAASSAAGGDEQTPDPKQIFEKSAAACRKIETIAYDFEQVQAYDTAKPVRLNATFRQTRAPGVDVGFVPGKFAFEGSNSARAGEAAKFAASFDGTLLRVVDNQEKVVRIANSPKPREVAVLLGGVALIGMGPFTAEKPFQLLFDRNPRFEYRGSKDVKGVDCHAVALTQTVDGPLGRQDLTATWFFGKDDFLPRGIDLGKVQNYVKILRINDPADAKEFSVKAPAGYVEKAVTGKEAKTKGLLPVGSSAPAWSLKDPTGREHTLEEYRGKIVLLDFWGTWCVPCRKAMPGLQALHEQYKDRGVAVIGVAVGDDEGDPAGYMKREGFTYHLMLKGDKVAKEYKARLLPTIYVVGKNGRIAHAESGLRDAAKDELAAIVERCLSDGDSSEKDKKPGNITVAVQALKKAAAAKPRSVADFVPLQIDVVSAADIVLGHADATNEHKEEALAAKAIALVRKAMYKPDSLSEFEEFAAFVESNHPTSAAIGTIDVARFSRKYMVAPGVNVDPAAVVALTALAKKHPKEEVIPHFYTTLALKMERAEGVKAAIDLLENGLKTFPNNEHLGGALRGLKVVGQPMELAGPMLDGAPFDLATLKGKVVLVDYWATWCGPCVAELPNVKKIYEKHRDQGFEVVGVSLDTNRMALESFVKEKEIPWPEIFVAEKKETSWDHPLARKYGVSSIPMTFLIGRDGKVVQRCLRGEALEKAVADELAKSVAAK